MKRLGSWILAFCLAVAVMGFASGAAAEVPPEFEAEEELISPEGASSSDPAGSGGSALVGAEVGGGEGLGAGDAQSGEFWSWVADRGLGAVKGIGAGLIAAGGIALGALVIGASAPVLLLGAAVIGGAAYGLMAGSQHFNWTEAIVGSLIGGLSAGVGGWLATTGSALIARVGAAVANLVAGGLTGVISYLTHSQEITWGGVLGAFGLGAAATGLFMGAGALAGRFWAWGKGVLGLRPRTVAGGATKSAMVQASLADDVDPPGGVATGSGGSRNASPGLHDARTGDSPDWRPNQKYQYDLFNEGPLPREQAQNFMGMKYNTRILDQDLVLYRAGKAGRPLGEWFTYEPAASEAQVRIDLAVKRQWLDRETGALLGESMIDTVYEIKVPKGTVLYEGPVASQGGIYLGGAHVTQVYIRKPWELRGVEVLRSWRIAK